MDWFDNISFKIKSYVRWAKKFFGHDIWQFNLDEFSKAKARLIRDIKVIIDAMHNFASEKIGFQDDADMRIVIPEEAVLFMGIKKTEAFALNVSVRPNGYTVLPV